MKSKDRVTYYALRVIGDDEPCQKPRFDTAREEMQAAENQYWFDIETGSPKTFEAVRVEVTPI